LKLFQAWGERDKGEWGVEFKYVIFDIRIFVNTTMYPPTQHNNNKKKSPSIAEVSFFTDDLI
jgi:hypothetical protein